ncbi:hypothetical protein F4677DRAFT_434485 [Hypoxylon crocopeplum]|nr:hypothetical protein F4677DRAFT_434485 [Hypoxylon crocopeplum]
MTRAYCSSSYGSITTFVVKRSVIGFVTGQSSASKQPPRQPFSSGSLSCNQSKTLKITTPAAAAPTVRSSDTATPPQFDRLLRARIFISSYPITDTLSPSSMYRHHWNSREANRRRQAAEAGRHRAAAQRPLQVIAMPPPSISDVPATGMGQLATLPNEVIMVVFGNCSLRTLMRLERVNKAAKTFVSLLRDIVFVRSTAKGIIERAVPSYRRFMFTILKITTYRGLRYLLTTYDCEVCGKPGKFQMIKVKVLCEDCHSKKLKNV